MTNLKDLLSGDEDFYDDDDEYNENYYAVVNSNTYPYEEESYDDRTMDWGYLADLEEEGWWTDPNAQTTIKDVIAKYD